MQLGGGWKDAGMVVRRATVSTRPALGRAASLLGPASDPRISLHARTSTPHLHFTRSHRRRLPRHRHCQHHRQHPGGRRAACPDVMARLVVAPEQRCSPYDVDDYRYPQSVEDRIVDELGGVYGPYTGRWFASTSDTAIEHMVARSEAHDSGLCAADLATRRRFATDLLNLTLAGPQMNRYDKVDRDAAQWLPAQNRCWFASRPG